MNTEELDFTDAQMLRLKAEEKLKEERKQKSDKPLVITDELKLVHELQVHQIELEMQNEELRQTYTKTEAALKKYTMLYDLSPMGYFTLDADGSILELNFTGADMLGDRRFSLINANFKLFVSEESRSVFNNFLDKVYTSGSKESCEVMLGYDKTPLCLVYMEGIINGDDKKCLLSLFDISTLKNKTIHK